MKTQNCTFGVIFYLKKQKTTAQGKAPIYARVTVNGKRTEISVKRSVVVSGWDAKKGLAKGSREETAELNRFLARFQGKNHRCLPRIGIVGEYSRRSGHP
ncbi:MULTISPECIES: Arm DNA-binding domain-containing protein [Sphingobacterium]|uniref:Arm DNA-binding domain-containing protein n=1 Tax=Sphingobacterium TaxID=28453 RepID=UPI0025796DA6|nr:MULTISPECIES: Arm DNA-binding domain-containing protein [Sphingobacterium]